MKAEIKSDKNPPTRSSTFSIYHPKLWIEGVESEGNGASLEINNPSTGEVGAFFKSASFVDVDRAFQSAKSAQSGWEALGFENRWRLIDKWKELLMSKKAQLLEILEAETGKSPWDAESELTAFFNKWPLTEKAYHEFLTEKKTEHESWTYRSMGVFAVLGPFNFPLHLPGGQILPALATGGAVIFKPSEFTSTASHLYVQTAHEAGIPPGILNLVLGAGDIGEAVISHPHLDAVLFTGSQRVGLSIYQKLASTPHKLVALEMGGCNALVISAVKDIEAAVSQIILSSFISSGQRCSCTRRLILIENPAYPSLLKAFLGKARKIKIGAYFEAQNPSQVPFMGPLIRPQGVQEVLQFQERLLARGGQILLKAERLNKKGNWISPGVILMKKESLISNEECFGPILQVCLAKDLDEAIDIANDTTMGLTASLLSDNPSEFDSFRQKVNAGVINWNEPTTGASSKLPFGGIKGSGNHRPSGYTMITSCVWPVASKTCATLKPTQLIGVDS